jgi:hypothetical protein
MSHDVTCDFLLSLLFVLIQKVTKKSSREDDGILRDGSLRLKYCTTVLPGIINSIAYVFVQCPIYQNIFIGTLNVDKFC